jgi:predicted site-specific integrase-resolvase
MEKSVRPFSFSDKGLLSKRHAAVWADVSRRTLDRWIQQGLPVYQASPHTKVLIRPADIEFFLKRKHLPKADLIAKVEEVVAQLRRQPLSSKKSDSRGCPEV